MEREPKHRAVAARVETRAQRAAAPEYQGEAEPAAVAAGAKAGAGTAPVATSAPTGTPGGPAPVITPRPRQQRGRKRK
jgi:hypothetical protein